MQQSLPSIFFQRAADLSSAVAVRFKEGRSPYRDLSWSDFSQMVREMAAGLTTLGLEPGSCAAIFSQTSHLWVASDLSIMSCGAVSVPVYPTGSYSDIEYILQESQAALIFVQNEGLLNKVLKLKSELPQLKRIILLSPPSGGKSLSELCLEEGLVIGLEELQEAGRQALTESPDLISQRLQGITLNEPATIIYTSGTTGTPKGVMLTHHNIISVLGDLPKVIPVSKDGVYLSFLPLSHVFERVCGEFYWLHSGGVCAFAEGIEHVGKNMAEVQPSMILVVPRVLDRIYAKINSGIEGASSRARSLIKWGLSVGKQVVAHKAEGRPIGQALKLQHWAAEKLVLSKLRTRIGQRLSLIVSGGAPATVEVIEFFNAIGINTLEGYGLTETSAPASVNPIDRPKAGTVGRVLPSVEVKIAEDGEILIKGPSVFTGYFKAPDASSEVITDGWFHSGDIGTIDGDGYLTITDRKKDLIVNSAGKNIAPQRIEAVLKTIPCISQAIVFGDKKKHLVALLALDETSIVEYAREKSWVFDNFQQLICSPEVKQFVRQQLNEKGTRLSDHERIRNFAFLDQDLSVDAGELTATLKVKRNAVQEKYRSLIESLYKEEDALVSSAR